MSAKTIALIPARGGSKGLPGKNIRPLLGKPLLHYSVEAALGCHRVDAVYVSSDDPRILEVARDAGALTAPPRSSELANDTASSLDVTCDFLTWYERAFSERIDTLILLQPTSPLRTAAHLQAALQLYDFHRSEAPTIVSVTPAKPLAWQGQIAPDAGHFQPHQQASANTNRQIEPANYQLNGAIYIAPASRYLNRTFMQAPVYPYIMSAQASVDIDTLSDFLLAEALLRAQSTVSGTALRGC
ncbi:acylneuraminate cytidylyltransferase family protein [Vampirovibrio chlorellavorus]|uniref:acylneuraminate cytidylyltransferase family protein n=1 Tax=Vampirovibrio chlorellavorus TaxID=758823 RepID=UPI0026ED21C2|nr:acylneuraminate cytidylyltransferase family protein [Vampirovibrio chlorellavorus]